MSNFCHPENPGSSHWLGCACSESAWAEKLAATEARVRGLEEALRETEKTARYYRRHYEDERLIADAGRRDMVIELRGRLGVLAAALEAIAEPECRIRPSCNDGGWGDKCPSCIARATLAPPPEAEKRGEE